jgi:hypothetical protein
MDWPNADGTSMMKPHTFSATPTPALAIRPSELTIARMIRKLMPTRKSASAIGAPKPTMRRITFPSKRKSLLRRRNGSWI